MDSQDGRRPVAYSASDVPTERFHVVPRPLDADGIAEMIERLRRRHPAPGERGPRRSRGRRQPRLSARAVPEPAREPSRRRVRRGPGPFPAGNARGGPCAPRRPVVGLRISVDELNPEGLASDEVLSALAALRDRGLLDYLHVTAGSSATLGGSVHIVPPMNVENAYTVPLAQRAREVVDVPIIVAGRINEPQQAERVLAAGSADACAMTRALISDPDMPRKVMDGRADSSAPASAATRRASGTSMPAIRSRASSTRRPAGSCATGPWRKPRARAGC